MNRLVGFMLSVAALSLAACDEKSKPPEAPRPNAGTRAEAAPPATASQGHAPQEHAHAAPHGGLVQSTSKGHLELVATREGTFQVYVLDEQLAPLPVTGATGTLKLTVPGYADVKLAPAGDHLAGKGAAFQAEHPTAVVSVTLGGATQTARFALHLEAGGHGDGHPHAPGTPAHSHGRLDAVQGTLSAKPCPAGAGPLSAACVDGQVFFFTKEGEAAPRALVPAAGVSFSKLAPHVGRKVSLSGKPLEGEPARMEVTAVIPEHDHTPLQGGMVVMIGDLHLEVLARKEGEVRVYLTDAFRRPVPLAGRKGQVEIASAAGSSKTAPLLPSSGGDFLSARFDAFSTSPVEATVRLPVAEDPNYFITLLLEPGGAAASTPVEAAVVQSVKVDVQGRYAPERIVLKKGVPARLIFLRKDTSECSRELLIPEFGIKQVLAPLKETVVQFTPTQAGTFAFTCGMDMMRGTLVVQD
jgi:hypothetical protein